MRGGEGGVVESGVVVEGEEVVVDVAAGEGWGCCYCIVWFSGFGVSSCG